MIAPETLQLAPEAFAVGVNGDLVFLDVAKDAYVCLPDGERQGRLSSDRRRLTLADPGLAADLTTAGLVRAKPLREGPMNPDAADPAWAAPPTRSAFRDRYAPPRAADVTQVVVAMADLLAAYRGRPFAEIVRSVRQPRMHPPSVSPDLLTAVDAFHRWAPYAPTSAKCLLRSFMLLRLLHRRGLDALWVFGVRTWPFHAHCWLQCEDLVLDDEADRVRAFTPIMVV